VIILNDDRYQKHVQLQMYNTHQPSAAASALFSVSTAICYRQHVRKEGHCCRSLCSSERGTPLFVFFSACHKILGFSCMVCVFLVTSLKTVVFGPFRFLMTLLSSLFRGVGVLFVCVHFFMKLLILRI
jgi:hypothetical protein